MESQIAMGYECRNHLPKFEAVPIRKNPGIPRDAQDDGKKTLARPQSLPGSPSPLLVAWDANLVDQGMDGIEWTFTIWFTYLAYLIILA